MQIKRRALALAGAITLTGGLALAAAPAAFAGGAPAGCPVNAGAVNSGSGTLQGGQCSLGATITISTVLSLSTNETSFALNGNSLDTPSPTFQVQIASNDTTAPGYYLSIAGPAGNFSDGSATLPDSAVSYSHIGGSPMTGTACPAASTYSYQPLGNSGAATTVLAVNDVSGSLNCATGFTGYTVPAGDDSFDLFGFEITNVNGSPAGTYTGNVQLALWGA